jgi:hypothetical protein
MRPLMRGVGLAGGAAALLATAACSGSGDSARAATAVRDAASVTDTVRTSNVSTTVTMTTGGATTVMRGTGSFDYVHQIGAVSLEVPPSIDRTGEVDEVITPDELYLRHGATAGWAEVPVRDLTDGDLISAGLTYPAVAVAMLRGVADGAQEVGRDSVGGVAVSHYRGVLDLRRAAAQASAAPYRAALLTAARAFLGGVVPFDAYVDGAGRLRRFVGTYSYYLPHDRQLVTINSETDLTGFGVRVAIQRPAGARVATGIIG